MVVSKKPAAFPSGNLADNAKLMEMHERLGDCRMYLIGDIIDVGVEILPTKELQSHMSSGPSYYERELYNLIREGRGVPAVPLVLIGVAPD